MKRKVIIFAFTFLLGFSFLGVDVFAGKNENGERFYDFTKMNGGMSFSNEEDTKKNNERMIFPKQVKLNVPFVTQENNYYCGPASALMLLKTIGYNNYSQSSIANIIGTTENGTGAGYNYIPKGLNSIVEKDGKFKYSWSDHNYKDVDTIKLNIMTALSVGSPAIINTYESPGDCYIKGHNIGTELYYFGVISEYYLDGNAVTYLDPASGLFDGFVKSQQVNIKNISNAVGGRGYIW